MCDKAVANILSTTAKRIARIRNLYHTGITTLRAVKPTGRKISERYVQYCVHFTAMYVVSVTAQTQ